MKDYSIHLFNQMIMFVRKEGEYLDGDYNFHSSNERDYYVSKDGVCYSISKLTGSIKTLAGHINTSNGYPMVSVTGKHYYLHRLIAIGYIPNPYNLPVINHLNGDKQDHSISNLCWTTQQDNVQHAWDTKLNTATDNLRKSTSITGKKRRKLSMNQVKELRDLYFNKGFSQPKLSKKYNVSCSTVSKIVNNKRYVS